MASFGDMQRTVRLQVQANMTDDDVRQTINNVQRQVVESYNWTFCLVNAVLNSQTPRGNGTVTVTTGSPEVFGLGTSFRITDVGAFLWIGGLNIAPIPIVDVQGAQMCTLSAPWPGPGMAGSGYVLAPLYYPLVGALEVFEVRSIAPLEKLTRDEINNRDPARIAQGGSPASAWCPAPHAADGSVQIELWPVCTDARPYLCDIRRGAQTLVKDTDAPLAPSAVIEAKALMDACLSVFATTGNNQWVQLADIYRARYDKELEDNLIANARRVRHRTGAEPPRPRSPYIRDSLYSTNHDSFRT